jgi:hypothetical protein
MSGYFCAHCFNRTEEALREHGEAEAERIVRRALGILGLPATIKLTNALI